MSGGLEGMLRMDSEFCFCKRWKTEGCVLKDFVAFNILPKREGA